MVYTMVIPDGPDLEYLQTSLSKHPYIYFVAFLTNIKIDRLTPMPRTLLISITLMSIWLKFGETVTQKVGNMILRSYPGTS